jgi:transglutaminase-like putative cysteine protease
MVKLKTKPAAQQGTPAAPLEHAAVPWLLIAALATAGPHVDHLPPWISLLVGSVLIWRTWLWVKRRPLPEHWPLAMFVAGGVAGIGWQFQTLFGRDAGVAMLVLFMALKPMEMRTRRDALVVVMLGFFLLLTHYFYSQSIPTGLWLLATTTLLTATLIRLQGGAQPVKKIARYALLLLAQALPFMLILYLLFPRISGPLWGLPQDAHSGMSGLSDKMAPGSLSNLIQSGAIAFRAKFTGDIPDKIHLYWRGPVMTEYDGRTWWAGVPPTSKNVTQHQIEPAGKSYAYVNTLEAHNQRWLLALDLPTTRPADSEMAPTLETLAREPVRLRERFPFTSTVGFRVNRIESSALLQQSLRLPQDGNPRAHALAAEWKSRLGSAEKIRDAALAMFSSEAFFYTLRPPLLGQQPIDEFLFTTRKGFCEHYASAFVYLLRAAGVPARVVTGYQGGELNTVDGFLTVRQSDAHAWAEIWITGQGWVRVDPTAAVAPSRVEQGITAALADGEPLPMLARIDVDWLLTLRNRWEAANNAWNQWVLGYNPQRQREVLAKLGFTEPDWRSMTAALATLCGAALLIITFWSLYQHQTIDPAQRAWRRFCSGLSSRGIIHNAWEGPFEFAERVAREQPDLAALTQEAAKHYAALRYGRGGPLQLRQLRECARRLPSRWRIQIETKL